MENQEEIWKAVVGYEGMYEVSNLGRVKSLSRILTVHNNKYMSKDIILKACISNEYYIVCVCKNNISKTKRVHRLVAEAFIDNPQNKPCVNHKNGIKTDNRLDNLEWVTISENTQHSFDNGFQVAYIKGKYFGDSIASRRVLQYDLQGNFIKEYDSIKRAAVENNMYGANISHCCTGRIKKSGGFIWKHK